MSAKASFQPAAPRVLHVHGTLAEGNPQAERSMRVIAAFGARLRHTLVAADGDFGAAEQLPRGIAVERRNDFPQLAGLPLPGRMQCLARAMIDYDLVLTYGWGAIDAALARTMFSQVHSLPPLIHHEDGSDETPSERRRWRSTWYRRVGLGRAAGLVVPTETMEGVALIGWQQPMGRVKLVPDGIDPAPYRRAARSDALPRLLKRPGEYWVGCFAPPGAGGALAALVGAVAELDPNWHLVVVGAEMAQASIEAAIARHNLDHRVHFVPSHSGRAATLALFDIVAVVGGREALPLAALEAMAAGKPLVGIETGDLAASLSPENAALIVGESGVLAEPLQRLAGDSYLRKSIGAANRGKASVERDEKAMIAAYRRLYASALGRPSL